MRRLLHISAYALGSVELRGTLLRLHDDVQGPRIRYPGPIPRPTSGDLTLTRSFQSSQRTGTPTRDTASVSQTCKGRGHALGMIGSRIAFTRIRGRPANLFVICVHVPHLKYILAASKVSKTLRLRLFPSLSDIFKKPETLL